MAKYLSFSLQRDVVRLQEAINARTYWTVECEAYIAYGFGLVQSFGAVRDGFVEWWGSK